MTHLMYIYEIIGELMTISKKTKEMQVLLAKDKKKNVAKRQVKLAMKADVVFDDILNQMIKGTFGPSSMMTIVQRHKCAVPDVRAIAAQAAGTLRQLQELSDDTEEAKIMMKSNVNTKLQSMLESAQKDKDYKAANAIIQTYCKLNNLFTPDGPQISNTIGIFSKFTDAELAHVRAGFDLPETVLNDLENRK